MTDTPAATPDTPAPASTMRRDILSAYVLTAARIGSWVVVSAVVYRFLGPTAFAMVALVRATVGLVGYVSLGTGPAIVRMLSVAERSPGAQPRTADDATAIATPTHSGEAVKPVLGYAAGAERPSASEVVARVYATGENVAIVLGVVAVALAGAYSQAFQYIHDVPDRYIGSTQMLALMFGVGIGLRVISEAPAGLLQVRGRIWLDNWLASMAELLWAGITAAMLLNAPGSADRPVQVVGVAYALANLALLLGRSVAGRIEVRSLTTSAASFDWSVARPLLAFGGLVTLAQLADFLYAPVDYILINHLISPEAVAVYAPAVQMDAALLLSVTAVAAVLLPKAALAHAAGDVKRVRRYYVRGTLATGAMLVAGAAVAWALSPWVFQLWLGEPMAATRALLPLVLVHTVIGGSGAVGRSILLGMGKVRPFAVSVLLAGVGNVAVSYLFVRMGLGLNGIVLGTVVVVTLRAGVWMPWYVMRAIKGEGGRMKDEG